jgi:hypothetical protein
MIFCYGLLLEYERALRHVLWIEGYENIDLFNFFKEGKYYSLFLQRHNLFGYDEYEILEKIDTYEPFQAFYLNELLLFMKTLVLSKKVSININIDYNITTFRNSIMHATNPISKNESEVSDYFIYNIDDYNNLINHVGYLEETIGVIRNYIQNYQNSNLL